MLSLSQAETELGHRQTLRKILITTLKKERRGLCFELGVPGVEGNNQSMVQMYAWSYNSTFKIQMAVNGMKK